MRIVNHRERLVFLSQVTDPAQLRYRPVHRKAAVRGDQAHSRAARLVQLSFEVGHVVMFVTKTLRFAEPDTINDRRVIQFIRDDRVLSAEQRLKQTAIGVEG